MLRHQLTRFELKDGRRLCFYPCVFNVETTVSDRLPDGSIRTYREMILPGAFAATLAARMPVVFNLDHDDKKAFATYPTDGLLQEDAHGLFASCWLPETPIGDEIIRRYNAGDLYGASFDGNVPDVPEQGGSIKRTAIQLKDVCLTLRPAYPQTKGEVVIRSELLNINLLRARLALAKFKVR